MEPYYFIDANNDQQGPIGADQFLSYGLTRETKVWKSGMADWTEAGNIPELDAVFAYRTERVPPVPTTPAANTPFTPPTENKSSNAPQMTMPDNYLVWSILATLLCCLPLGVVGIVYSNKVDNLWNKGDYEGAISASKNAKLYCILSLILGVIGVILSFILGFASALLQI